MSGTAKRVVLDTNQIVAAGTRWLIGDVPNANWNQHRRMLAHVAARHVGLYCSEIVDEYIEKLTTKGHPTDRIEKLLALLAGAFDEVGSDDHGTASSATGPGRHGVHPLLPRRESGLSGLGGR